MTHMCDGSFKKEIAYSADSVVWFLKHFQESDQVLK